MISKYLRLTKPGIVRGNAITAAAGFLFVARTDFETITFVVTVLGLSLVVASGCVFNNYLDRQIDAKMKRTKKRALVTGDIRPAQALSFGSVLLACGLVLLATLTNLLTATIALIGFVFYVVVYGIAKRRTVYSTLIGSISGAIPPVVGYVGATNQLDLTAGLLFLILASWQMPHFYAIAIYRRKEYKEAGLPILSVVKGPEAARRQIIGYIFIFIAAVVSLWALGPASLPYAVLVTAIGLWWLSVALRSPQPTIDLWAKRVFGSSLLVLLIFFHKTLGWPKTIKLGLQLIPSLLGFRRGIPKMVLIAQFTGDNDQVVADRVHKLRLDMKEFGHDALFEEDENEEEEKKFWIMRRESFSLLRNKIKDKHTAPFIDDLVVPPEHLPVFLPELRKIINKYKLLATVAGHMGDGNFHVIPLMKFELPEEKAKLEPCMREVNALVLKYGGSMSGEHNDGMTRGPWLNQQYTEEIMQHFRTVKKTFDPLNIFNPHKKTDANWDYSMAHLREHF